MHMPSEPVWSWVETPIGDGLIVIGPQGAIRAAFSRPDGTGMPSEESVLIEAGAQLGAAPAHDPAALAEILERIEAWFDGSVQDLDVPVDLGPADGFRRAAWERIAQIPYGQTLAYGQLAAEAGRPRAGRAAGTLCSEVQVPLFLPVHRVTRADGSTGEPDPRHAVRRMLIDHERAVLTGSPSPWA